MANVNHAPPGASPHAEKISSLEKLLQGLKTAADKGLADEIKAVAYAATCMLPPTASREAELLSREAIPPDDADKLDAARRVLAGLGTYVQGILDTLRDLPPPPLPAQDGMSEMAAQREISRLLTSAAALQLPKGSKSADLVRRVASLYEYTPGWIKSYPPGSDDKSITAYKLLMAAASGSSNDAIARWWRDEGKLTPWDEHVRRADIQLSAHVKETEEEVHERFKQYARSFDWTKEHKNEDDIPVLPSVMYAAKLSTILADAPSQMSGEDSSGWLYASVATKYLPADVETGITFSSRNKPQEVLAAIKRIPRSAYEKAERARAMNDERTTRAILAHLTPPARSDPRAAPRAQQQQQGSTAVYAPLPSERPAVQQGDIMPRYWEKLSNDVRRSFSLAQVNPISFPDSPTGRESYSKAVASFVQTHGLSPPLSAKFPLTPGTASVPSTSCDKCGLVGHLSYACSSTSPVPAAKRNYRRQWRMVESNKRANTRERAAPSWFTKPEKQVNMLGEVDLLMGYEQDLFYPSQDDIDASLAEAGKA